MVKKNVQTSWRTNVELVWAYAPHLSILLRDGHVKKQRSQGRWVMCPSMRSVAPGHKSTIEYHHKAPGPGSYMRPGHDFFLVRCIDDLLPWRGFCSYLGPQILHPFPYIENSLRFVRDKITQLHIIALSSWLCTNWTVFLSGKKLPKLRLKKSTIPWVFSFAEIYICNSFGKKEHFVFCFRKIVCYDVFSPLKTWGCVKKQNITTWILGMSNLFSPTSYISTASFSSCAQNE